MTEQLSAYERKQILEVRIANLKAGRGEHTALSRADAIADALDSLTQAKREIANTEHWAAL